MEKKGKSYEYRYQSVLEAKNKIKKNRCTFYSYIYLLCSSSGIRINIVHRIVIGNV